MTCINIIIGSGKPDLMWSKVQHRQIGKQFRVIDGAWSNKVCEHVPPVALYWTNIKLTLLLNSPSHSDYFNGMSGGSINMIKVWYKPTRFRTDTSRW